MRFISVLETMEERAGPHPTPSNQWSSARAICIESGPLAPSIPSVAVVERYGQFTEPQTRSEAITAEPVSPQPIGDGDLEAAVRHDLQLSRPRTRAELQQLRRDFALRHHPDLCQGVGRIVNLRKLQIANDVLDVEIMAVRLAEETSAEVERGDY